MWKIRSSRLCSHDIFQRLKKATQILRETGVFFTHFACLFYVDLKHSLTCNLSAIFSSENGPGQSCGIRIFYTMQIRNQLCKNNRPMNSSTYFPLKSIFVSILQANFHMEYTHIPHQNTHKKTSSKHSTICSSPDL